MTRMLENILGVSILVNGTTYFGCLYPMRNCSSWSVLPCVWSAAQREKSWPNLLIRESLGTFFSLERSGLATLWQLLKNPRFVISNYLDGNRGYHQPPNKLLFYALVVYGLHVTLVDSHVLNLTLDIEGTTPSLFFYAPRYSIS